MSTADYCKSFSMDQHNIRHMQYLPLRAFKKQGIRTKYIIKIIPKTRLYITENCALHFSNKRARNSNSRTG